MTASDREIIDRLYQRVMERQRQLPENSYVADLFRQGRDRILQKVGEEAIEVVLAAKNGQSQRTIHEIADLCFHLLVMMAEQGLTPDQVYAELNDRYRTQTHAHDNREEKPCPKP